MRRSILRLSDTGFHHASTYRSIRILGTPIGAVLPLGAMAAPPREATGRFGLWGGWSIEIPRAMQQRNEDGSWSAWGTDWAVDVHIIEAIPPGSGSTRQAPQVNGDETVIRGDGWDGGAKLLIEKDNGRPVFRYAATLRAPGTVMSCWVSYFDARQAIFARSMVASAVHDA